jgi:hypothetical protein
MLFNLNDYVWVKLTYIGRAALRQQVEDLRKEFPQISHIYSLPKEDKKGWSKWQLHVLMSTFGHMLGNGMDLPFETEIKIGEK